MDSIVKAWWITVRPKTLTATIVPVTVGTALAWREAGQIDLWIAFCTLSFGLAIQIATNFFNDVGDWKKKADGDSRLGPRRAIQQGFATPVQITYAGIALLCIALAFSIPLWQKGGVSIGYLTAASLLCSYCYTCGPFPLAYWGLGELFVLIFFGLAATITSYFLQANSVSSTAVVAGLQLGLLATNLLAINNLRDRFEDSSNGKNTLAVLFNETFARTEIAFCTAAPFFLLPFWYIEGFFLAALLPLIFVPLAYKLIADIATTLPGSRYNAFLAKAALLHFLFGMSLALAIL